MATPLDRPLTVLVVDDSAVVRVMLTELLTDGGMIPITAADPLIALEKMRHARPDVIVLDIEMPKMDGLTFLRKIMKQAPTPVVICSAHAGSGSDAQLAALNEGAVEIIAKPAFGVRNFLADSAVQFLDAVRAASQARMNRPPPVGRSTVPPPPKANTPQAVADGDVIIAIGASTGGTDAIERVLASLPQDAPPVVVVQHMPARFTTMFAARLNDQCAITVKEAVHDDALARGLALLAPGNRHMRVVRSGGLHVAIDDGPLVTRHRPSVDVLFSSVARVAGKRAVAAILTGMGDDGAAGMVALKSAGAFTFAQDEDTCVVFGMPNVAIKRGAVDRVLPIDEIGAALLDAAFAKRDGG